MTKKFQVLIVDDSDDDREFCEEILQEDDQREWAITSTESSQRALELVSEHQFDCVLLDYSMPRYNGIEVMQQLREHNTEVPVVMLTGQGTERIAVEAMKAGAQDYVSKQDIALPHLSKTILEAIERQQAKLDLLQRANYDHLTGLAGRALFNDRLRGAFSRSDRNQKPFALLFVDLDKSKAVNDTMGHKFGDLLLKEVAARMIECTREGDTVARLGGDEFVLVLEDLPGDGRDIARQMVKRIAQAVADHPYSLEGHEVVVGTSIGVAIYPTTATDRKALMEAADLAMYEAKKTPGMHYKVA
tara:strand:- start:8844 stop:9749 length:906 start_codon:yes stop_codon:yes gene_type:complete